MTNLIQLAEILDQVGKPVEYWQSSDGTRVLVLPYGGRVLGMFPPGDDENFLWTHPALNSAETAREFYQSPLWHNSGGDRTWLAPEVDFFFPEYPSLKQYWQQRELDPGRYEPSRREGSIQWSNRARLKLSRSGQSIELQITKSLAPSLDPLRHESGHSMLKYAGYTLRTTLELLGDSPTPIGLWHLLQLPHGGDMLVPTLSRSQPKIYMGTIAPDDLLVGEHLVRYRMRAAGEHKLGIRAIAITGRAGYMRRTGEAASLVVRNFQVNPSGEYVDVPWLEPENFGFAFQACNVNSSLGAFSELEYHVPALRPKAGTATSVDESQVWAYRGSVSEIRAVAQRLLSSEILARA